MHQQQIILNGCIHLRVFETMMEKKRKKEKNKKNRNEKRKEEKKRKRNSIQCFFVFDKILI